MSGNPAVKITPKRDSSVVTALVAYKDSLEKTLSQNLQEKKLAMLREHFSTLLGEQVVTKLDLFKLREDTDSWFCLLRAPCDMLRDLLAPRDMVVCF